jgi:2',3'-cyclic-nucleotide 2'-phosphodiesterase (5'-nucleotidase family)
MEATRDGWPARALVLDLGIVPNSGNVALFAALLAACAACSAGSAADLPRSPTRTAEPQTTLTLSFVALNDLHGRIRALPLFGGYVANLRRARAADGAVVVLDSGDTIPGTLESNLSQGRSLISAYDALGVSALALGNHEFDFGPLRNADGSSGSDPQGALKERLRQASFPILGANLRDRASGQRPQWQNLKSSVLIDVRGVKVGLIGVLTEATPRIVMRSWFAGLEVAPLAPAIAHEAAELRKAGATLVIVLAHAGAECERFDDPRDLSSCDDGEIFEVVRQLPHGAVNAVFAGHSHAGIAHFVEDVAVTEAYAYGHAFSRIDFQVERPSGRVLAVLPFRPHRLCALPPHESCNPGSYLGEPVEIDAKVAAAIRPALEHARELRDKKLGVTLLTAVLRAHTVESPLGNLFADLMLQASPASTVAIANGGSLRSDLPAGELTYGKLYEAMPFDNRLATFEISARDLAAVLVRHLTSERHGIVSLAGLRVVARCGTGGLEVSLVTASGAVVPEETRLRAVTSDYLATGGDALFQGAVSEAQVTIQPPLLRDALATGLERLGTLRGDDPRWFDPRTPRLRLPAPRPVRCAIQ